MITRIKNKGLGQIKLERMKSQFKNVISRWLIPWWNWTTSEPSNRRELVKQFSEWSTRGLMGQTFTFTLWLPSLFLEWLPVYLFFNVCFHLFFYFNWKLITLQYCSSFCYTSTWISHGCTCVPVHPELPSHLPPHPIPQGHPSALDLSALSHASNLDWWSISHMIIYMFQCYSLKSSHPCLLPQSPKGCSLSLCLFCCLTYRVIITIFLNAIYMC